MPGITGWAQINGRNAISWQQKFEFDVWYVDNINFALDFRIFVKTIQKTLKREAINPDNMAYTEDFNGHN
jgi:lipopolysaccharide/colanic/teichoic acid biosynthesis glycosyltransferase